MLITRINSNASLRLLSFSHIFSSSEMEEKCVVCSKPILRLFSFKKSLSSLIAQIGLRSQNSFFGNTFFLGHYGKSVGIFM